MATAGKEASVGRLKYCPWCGGYANMRREPMWHGSHGYTGCFEFFVQCSNEACGAVAPNGRFNSIYNTCAFAEQKAEEAWNRRKKKRKEG